MRPQPSFNEGGLRGIESSYQSDNQYRESQGTALQPYQELPGGGGTRGRTSIGEQKAWDDGGNPILRRLLLGGAPDLRSSRYAGDRTPVKRELMWDAIEAASWLPLPGSGRLLGKADDAGRIGSKAVGMPWYKIPYRPYMGPRYRPYGGAARIADDIPRLSGRATRRNTRGRFIAASDDIAGYLPLRQPTSQFWTSRYFPRWPR